LTRLLGEKIPERNLRYSQPYALILAPTRELAVQIHKEVVKFSYESWIRSTVIYGGAPSGSQMRELERGVDIVVGTPGRVKDFIKRGKNFF
jgi:superfamily II DNA/RNA helicase